MNNRDLVAQTLTPTATQLAHAALLGWVYEGLGLFTRGEEMGYFSPRGFVRL